MKPNPPYRDADMAALCARLKKMRCSFYVSLNGDVSLRRLKPAEPKPPEDSTCPQSPIK